MSRGAWLLAPLVLVLAGCASAQKAEPAAPAATAPVASAAPAPAASRPAGMPPPECLQVLDRLSQDIPRDETGPVLRSKGLRIATPLHVPEGIVTETGIVSAARVRMMIDRQGKVVPGTVTVQQSVGDPKLPLALGDLAPATLSFDVSGAFSLPPQFPFTTVYVLCARR